MIVEGLNFVEYPTPREKYLMSAFGESAWWEKDRVCDDSEWDSIPSRCERFARRLNEDMYRADSPVVEEGRFVVPNCGALVLFREYADWTFKHALYVSWDHEGFEKHYGITIPWAAYLSFTSWLRKLCYHATSPIPVSSRKRDSLEREYRRLLK